MYFKEMISKRCIIDFVIIVNHLWNSPNKTHGLYTCKQWSWMNFIVAGYTRLSTFFLLLLQGCLGNRALQRACTHWLLKFFSHKNPSILELHSFLEGLNASFAYYHDPEGKKNRHELGNLCSFDDLTDQVLEWALDLEVCGEHIHVW